MFLTRLPDWLVVCFRVALLGEIYREIRAIAIGYNEKGELLIRYYLDREPTDFDRESVEVVATNVDAANSAGVISRIDVECLYVSGFQRDLPPLSGFVYARREFI
ncbi:colicin [Stenotrophomonas maltophilia]|nr:colicin [Stenotrophomonas maltophilia]